MFLFTCEGVGSEQDHMLASDIFPARSGAGTLLGAWRVSIATGILVAAQLLISKLSVLYKHDACPHRQVFLFPLRRA